LKLRFFRHCDVVDVCKEPAAVVHVGEELRWTGKVKTVNRVRLWNSKGWMGGAGGEDNTN
jgi:hypothetical protein